jgi:toxin CptA
MHGLRIFPWSLVALEINPKNELNLQCLNGRQMLNVKMSEESIATEYLVILRYIPLDTNKLQGLLSRHVLILPDAIETNAFRRLRVWLRWGTLRK